MARTNIEQLRKANWGQLEQDVVKKLHLLRAMVEHIEPSELTDKIADDCILPALELLANFCGCVQVGQEMRDGDD